MAELRVLPCFVCGRQLEPAYDKPDDKVIWVQPYDANKFSSSGHYGATYFDDMHGQIAINVCTGCLEEHEDRIAHYAYHTTHEQIDLGPVNP